MNASQRHGSRWCSLVRHLSFRNLPFRDLSFRNLPFRNLPFRNLPFRNLPFRNLPFRNLPFRNLPFRNLPFRNLPFRNHKRSTCRKPPCEYVSPVLALCSFLQCAVWHYGARIPPPPLLRLTTFFQRNRVGVDVCRWRSEATARHGCCAMVAG